MKGSPQISQPASLMNGLWGNRRVDGCVVILSTNTSLLEEMKIKKPVLFIVDGHKSHLTLHLSNFCSENGIEIIALFPNSTHILQPLDLAVFRPLKVFWKKAATKWKLENLGKNIRKENFAPVLQKAVQQLTSDCVKKGFRAGGLFPFGPDYIDM